MSIESSMVAAIINGRLIAYVLARKLGWFFQSDGGLQIFKDAPAKVRFADGAFISRSRMPQRPGDGHLRTAPDLVIEVVSPTDEASDIDQKVAEYFEAGMRLVWVVYPRTRSVMVCRPTGNESRLAGGDTLSGEDVVAGFELPVAEIFDF